LAPSEFWFFGHLKIASVEQQFTRPVDLVEDIQAFLDEIQRSKLEYVFSHWIKQVE
jgi:hypothetical protein